MIWSLIGVGFAVGLLPRHRPSRAVLVFASLLLAYAIWTAASLTWSASSERTTVEVARVLDYLGLVVLLATALDTRTWRPAAAGLGFGALLASALSLGSRLVPAAFPADAVTSALHFDRLSYPLGYWNAIAAWGAMSTTFGLAWSAHDESRAGRAIALGLVPFAVAATYLTYSRACVAGTALGVVAVFAFSRNRLTVAVHAVVAAAGASAVILAIRGAPRSRTQPDRRAPRGSSRRSCSRPGSAPLPLPPPGCSAWIAKRCRMQLPARSVRSACSSCCCRQSRSDRVNSPSPGIRSATRTDPELGSGSPAGEPQRESVPRVEERAQGVLAHPMTGTGAGTFAFWWNQHATDYEFLRDTHNIWLQNLAELGVPGALLIVAVAVAALAVGVFVRRRARRRSSAGAAAAFISVFIVYLLHATVDWMWESTAVTVLAIAGLSTISIRLGRAPRATRWPIRAAVTLGAVIVCGLQAPGLLSTLQIRRSQAAERSGKTSVALGWAKTRSARSRGPQCPRAAGARVRGSRRFRSRRPVPAQCDAPRANQLRAVATARPRRNRAGEFCLGADGLLLGARSQTTSAAFVYAPYFRTR